MQQTSDPRIKIFGIISILLVLFGLIFIFSGDKDEKNSGIPKLKVSETRFDFGDISMANGLVTHNFTIENSGNGNLKISEIKTSCMCTSAIFEYNGERSPKFGMHNNPVFWSKEIKPGKSANLEVTFNPNAHGPDATGPVTRVVSMLTNDGGENNQETKFIFSANVTK